MKRKVQRAKLVRTDKDKNGKPIPIYRIETNEITKDQMDLMTGKKEVQRVRM